MRSVVAGRRWLPAFAAVAIAVSGAPAARAGEFNWGGIYTGAQLGGAWSDIDWNFTNANYFNTLGATVVGSTLDNSPSGVMGGVLGGYNYMTGPWLLGVELAASAATLSEERASTLFPNTDVNTAKLNWLTSATARLGYTWDRWLVYGKGGWAGGEASLSLHDQSASVYASEDQWANGWTAGGGVEFMLCAWASLGVGYDYAELSIDNKSITCPNCGSGAGLGTPLVDANVKVQSVMARLSFHP